MKSKLISLASELNLVTLKSATRLTDAITINRLPYLDVKMIDYNNIHEI